MPMDSRPPGFQHMHVAQNWNHQNAGFVQQQHQGQLTRRLSTPTTKSGMGMAPPVTITATQHISHMHPTSPSLPQHLGSAPGMPQMNQPPAMGQLPMQAPLTVSPPLAGGGGGPTNEPPWECIFSKPIGNTEAQKLTKFNLTEASGGSLEGAVALLNKLGEAYPHNYAVVYRKTLQQFFLVGRRGSPVSASAAVSAHEKFVTSTTDAPRSHKPWKARDKAERQQYPLEDRLTKHLVGQRASILSVAAQLRRKENGWHSSEHPLVFLFMGSSGIGKTELAKQVAKYLHEDSADAFIRLDMTEYQQPHEVSKFIGAPPGYLGHDEAGQLTRRLKQCPDAVVLFDEVEKAHPDILTCLLQTFDEGRLTDGKGETVECMDAIFVMTSNLLQAEIANESNRVREKLISEGVTDPDDKELICTDFKEKVVLPALKRSFKRDEFVGRINEILFFLPFTQEQLQQLAIRELNKWKENATSRHGINLSWDDAVVRRLAEFYNIRYGARSIQHEMERRVVNRLAQAHEKDQIGKGSRVHLSVGGKDNQEIVVFAM